MAFTDLHTIEEMFEVLSVPIFRKSDMVSFHHRDMMRRDWVPYTIEESRSRAKRRKVESHGKAKRKALREQARLDVVANGTPLRELRKRCPTLIG